MRIGGLDAKRTKQLQKIAKRKEKQTLYLATSDKSTAGTSNTQTNDLQSDSSTTSENNSFDEVYEPSSKLHESSQSLACDNIAQICDRTGVSDRTAAFLVSSTLAAAGASSGHEYDVVDRHKIRRARKQSR